MILNIVTLPQRQQQIKDEVSRMGITAVYWPSVPADNSVASISRSHKQIVQFALNQKIKEICIGEDDLIFTSKNSWKYFLDNKPEDFDIYLGGIYNGIPFPDNSLYSFSGFHLYIMRERYYKQFLSTPENKNIDNAQKGQGKFYVCSPMVAKQRHGYSFHRKEVPDDERHLVDKTFLRD